MWQKFVKFLKTIIRIDDTTEVTHEYFFGENINRVRNSFKKNNTEAFADSTFKNIAANHIPKLETTEEILERHAKRFPKLFGKDAIDRTLLGGKKHGDE